MKCLIIILLFFISISSYQVNAQDGNSKSFQKTDTFMNNNLKHSVDPEILEFYLNYSSYTNPGKFEYMYENLPDSLTDLCRLIKSQLIHPVVDLPKYRDLIPPERSYEDLKYPTVQTILAGLKFYNQDGLIFNRKPNERLVVSCRYHAILLASILKYRGIPARLRYGFASYIYPGHNIYHVVCEMWNKKENRWILVDPDRQVIDLNSERFEFAGNVWLKYRKDELNPETYGVPNWWGANAILDALCHDLASVLGNEHIYFDRPPISADTTMNVKSMNAKKLALMDNVSKKMVHIDENFVELKELYSENKELQFGSYLKNYRAK
jgi:hypothetical protein